MKKLFYLVPVGMLFLCFSATGQKANIDSLKLVAQISQDQVELAKLQNMVDQKTKSMQGAAVDAQNSASENVNAAEKLNADPGNKKLASTANNKAGDAKSDSKKSRKESKKLDDLNKEIRDLKSKIAGNQAKLSSYSPTALVTPVAMPIPARPDTTQHP